MKYISVFVILCLSTSLYPQTKYLHCGHILDCKGNQALAERTIIVKGNAITAVYEKAKKEPHYFPAIIRSKALTIGPLITETFAKAFKAGVNIAFGTDTAVSPHGDNLKELQYMVEAGMPAYEAIKSGTVGSSRLLRIDDKFGTIEDGKMADIIAGDGNPLDDITLMQNVSFVMKDGVVHKDAQ